MKQTAISAILLLIFLAVFTTLPSDARVSFEPICEVSTDKMLKNLAKYELPQKKFFDVFPVAGNDLKCGIAEHMLNIAIIVTISPREYFYGIFHVHFSNKGEIKSSAAILPMEELSDLDDPAVTTKWCNFIKTVYPKELAEQGCE